MLIYDLDKGKIRERISFKNHLESLQLLYIHPSQPIQHIGDYLVIPTVFGMVSYVDQKIREKAYQHPPFLLYNLKTRSIEKAAPGKYWPVKYLGENLFNDFTPKISGDSQTIYLAYKFSDTIIAYNLASQQLNYHRIELPQSLPAESMPKGGNSGEQRRFKIEKAYLHNYLYYPQLKQHLVFFKPEAPFISNDQINRLGSIHWYLLVYDAEFKLKKQFCINMNEAEWYNENHFRLFTMATIQH